jgi:hypothetical protein
MIYTLNILAMILTIGFGLIGWVAPRYTMKKLDLSTDGCRVGLSEIRAANGALFVALGVAAVAIAQPLGFAMVGFAYAGAAIGRLTSIIVDKSGAIISWSFLAAEVLLGAFLILSNL